MLSYPEFRDALINGDVDFYDGYARRHYIVRGDNLYYTNNLGEVESVFKTFDLYLDYRMFPCYYQIGAYRSKRYDKSD